MVFGINKYVILLIYKIQTKLNNYQNKIRLQVLKSKLGHIDSDFDFYLPDVCTCPHKIYLYGNSNIFGQAKFLISPKGESGRFIMKKESGAAQGLTIITGNHSVSPSIGKWHKEDTLLRIGDIDKDVIVEEDVWIGANVTLLSGVTIGRGAIIGAGSVVRNNIPPYAIAIGNPAKVISFKFTPEEIIEHEKSLYPETERIDINRLKTNYMKHYTKRIRIIKDFLIS